VFEVRFVGEKSREQERTLYIYNNAIQFVCRKRRHCFLQSFINANLYKKPMCL